MFIKSRQLLLSVLLGSLVAASAQAGSRHFGGGLRSSLSGVSNKLSRSSGLSQPVRRLSQQNSSAGVQTLNRQVRPSLSTMDVIKAQNFASDVKGRVLKHQFTPSTMDVIKAGNALSDLKSRVLHR